jgi:hypothetical protein
VYNQPNSCKSVLCTIDLQSVDGLEKVAGVGAPIVVCEADTAAMHCYRRMDNMEVIDGSNRTILQSTLMIGEALKAKVMAVVAAEGGTGGVAAANCKLELLLKRNKLAIEVGNQLSIVHCRKMICMLEEKEAREMDGGF